MSEEKTKITLRISNSVYNYFKDKKNYQATINCILTDHVSSKSDSYGVGKIFKDNKIIELTKDTQVKLDLIKEKLDNEAFPCSITENDSLPTMISKFSKENVHIKIEQIDEIKARRESLYKERSAIYHEMIDSIDARIHQLLPRKYSYRKIYQEEILSGDDLKVDILVYVIQILERNFSGDLYYNDTHFSLLKLDEEDYKLAVIRFYTLLSVLDDIFSGESCTYDYQVFGNDYAKLLDEHRISKKRILKFIFYPIFEMQEAENDAENEAKNKVPEYNLGIYNIGCFDSFEAEVLFSTIFNGYINHSIETVEIEDSKFRGIDMTIGIQELKDWEFFNIIENGSKTVIRFLAEEYDQFWKDAYTGVNEEDNSMSIAEWKKRIEWTNNHKSKNS